MGAWLRQRKIKDFSEPDAFSFDIPRTRKKEGFSAFPFFVVGITGLRRYPQGGPSAGHSARPCALLRGSVSLFPRARGSPAPQRQKKEGNSLPFFCGGDNRAPPTPLKGSPRRGLRTPLARAHLSLSAASLRAEVRRLPDA